MSKSGFVCWLMGSVIFLATMLVYRVDWNPNGTLANTAYESVELGNSIALKGSFSDPFAPLPTGPSAHVAPGYPALVALIIRMFGTGPAGNFALGMVTKIVVAAQLALLPFLAEYMGLHCWTGAIAAAAWLVAAFPLERWESDFAGLLIVILAFPMYKAFRQEPSAAGAVGTGALWGLLLLLTPTPLLILGAWLVCLRIVSRRSWRQLSFLAMVPVLVVLPWLLRNYRVFHRPVFLRDNLGLELAVSNNPCATFSMDLNRQQTACFTTNHPNESYEEALRVRTLGEPTYNEIRLHEAISWISNNRGQFLLLTAQRFVAFWFPNSNGNPLKQGQLSRTEWMTYLFTLFSVPGLLLLWRSRNRAAFVLSMWLSLYPLMYYLTQFSPRYRDPILWATLLPGSYFVVVFLFGIAGKSMTVSAYENPSAAN